ncbi:Uncharacterised protein [[Clostridium] sordellii]|nr:hypothetical protein [Paeniclostridium sordellii]CEQ29803.1 Uncharacterised protein [[Clostridium] sordellii] [Paeniclostridium sordellii]
MEKISKTIGVCIGLPVLNLIVIEAIQGVVSIFGLNIGNAIVLA